MQEPNTKETSIIENPFIKKRNRNWEVEPPKSLITPISPPLGGREKTTSSHGIPQRHHNEKVLNIKDLEQTENSEGRPDKDNDEDISSAAIESGETILRDYLSYFTMHLSSHIRPIQQDPSSLCKPRISLSEFVDLYQRNQNPQGRHFVIHQHDHPIAGTHYDIRLQFSQTSSISFACMYGVPGNPNSKRLNRNATETRVHNVWNHLIETASHSTGSLLIWDIGEYEVLPRRSKYEPKLDPDSQPSDSSSNDEEIGKTAVTEPEKLAAAFKNRKIKYGTVHVSFKYPANNSLRLRLHGTRLPHNYTLIFRLTKAENRHKQPKKPVRKRRRQDPALSKATGPEETPPSSDAEFQENNDDIVSSQPQPVDTSKEITPVERELQEQEDETVRLTNAYPGATNTINSIHQRKWYLSVDRVASGFYKASKNPVRWERRRVLNGGGKGEDGGEVELLGWDPFFVGGREVEKSIVTGRCAEEVLADEGVVGFVGRKGWRAVLE